MGEQMWYVRACNIENKTTRNVKVKCLFVYGYEFCIRCAECWNDSLV